MGLGAGLDGPGKISTLPAFEHWTFQPVASRYTYWAILPTNLVAIYIHFWGKSKALF